MSEPDHERETTNLPKALPFDAMIFDVGGVFIGHDNERLFRRLAAACRGADDPIRLDEKVARVRAGAMDPRIGTGTRTVRDLYDELVRELHYGRDWRGFLADWSSHFSVDRGMLDLLQRLAEANRVVLFSNTNAEHWQEVLRLTDGVLGRYDAFLSHEIGDIKPHASAFRLVAARAGVKPHRALFVDDLAENVAAARALGFNGEVFTDRAALERSLDARAANTPAT